MAEKRRFDRRRPSDQRFYGLLVGITMQTLLQRRRLRRKVNNIRYYSQSTQEGYKVNNIRYYSQSTQEGYKVNNIRYYSQSTQEGYKVNNIRYYSQSTQEGYKVNNIRYYSQSTQEGYKVNNIRYYSQSTQEGYKGFFLVSSIDKKDSRVEVVSLLSQAPALGRLAVS
ncbi:hypothetical protein J6590_064938 [Homalodisca vitripennis]|nr:hypothetical protein J6590_064938 [Homalodisca vitripennis]